MNKTILVALAAAAFTLAGCADDTAETTDVTVDPGRTVVTPPANDMMMDTTGAMGTGTMTTDPMMADPMMADTTGM